MENKIFIECECGTEMIQLERDQYEGTQDIYMSFFRYGHNGNFPWKLRLQYIWQIIIKGHPYSDSIILNKQEQNELIKFLVGDNNESL
jgi:hypothetical protein